MVNTKHLTPEEKLRVCVEYCRRQNGRDGCKNCGLDDDLITDAIEQAKKKARVEYLEELTQLKKRLTNIK